MTITETLIGHLSIHQHHHRILSSFNQPKLQPSPSISKVERRKAKSRQNQKRYRERKKQVELATKARSIELRRKICHLEMYVRLLKPNSTMTTKVPQRLQQSQFRILTVELYSDLLERGVDAKTNPQVHAQLKSLLMSTCSQDCLIQSPEFCRGPQALIAQWEMWTMLHGKCQIQRVALERINGIMDGGEWIRLHSKISITFEAYTFNTLYPTLLYDMRARSLIGQELAFDIVQLVCFDEDNKICAIQFESTILQAWMRMLHNPTMVSDILDHSPMIQSFFIPLDPSYVFEQVRIMKVGLGNK